MDMAERERNLLHLDYVVKWRLQNEMNLSPFLTVQETVPISGAVKKEASLDLLPTERINPPFFFFTLQRKAGALFLFCWHVKWRAIFSQERERGREWHSSLGKGKDKRDAFSHLICNLTARFFNRPKNTPPLVYPQIVTESCTEENLFLLHKMKLESHTPAPTLNLVDVG